MCLGKNNNGDETFRMWIGEEDPIYDQIVSFQENKCSYLYKNIGNNVSKVK